MIHRFIIPGIVVGALHGAMFLIPNPPAPALPKAAALVLLKEFLPPPIPPIPDDEIDPPRGDERAVAPPVPVVPSTPTLPVSNDVITEPWVPDMPRANVNADALSAGLGDWSRGGLTSASGGTDLFNAIDLDEKPRTVFQIAPDYPSEAKRNQLQGTVTVMFKVDENGNVHDARVSATSDTVFNDTALRAVSRWRFAPGTLRGKRVAFKMSVPIAFNLSGGD